MKVLGALRNEWKEMSLSGRVQIGIFEGKIVPTVLKGCET